MAERMLRDNDEINDVKKRGYKVEAGCKATQLLHLTIRLKERGYARV